MNADLLREAADELRLDARLFSDEDAPFYIAVADCATFCADQQLVSGHSRAVARAYLGRDA